MPLNEYVVGLLLITNHAIGQPRKFTSRQISLLKMFDVGNVFGTFFREGHQYSSLFHA